MKVIIAGSRNLGEEETQCAVNEAVFEHNFRIKEIVSGKARGVDTAGEKIAKFIGVPVKDFPALWKSHGVSAGYKRNKQMAEYADALIAVWDGESRGTAHMIKEMERLGKLVFVKKFTPKLPMLKPLPKGI